MLHSLLVALALLSSPAQWCGGGGCCVRPPHNQGLAFVAPALSVSIAPPRVDVMNILRFDQYPQPLRVALAIIAPRPVSNAMITTLQVEAQDR